ncbi:MAG TPA: PEP/pyruvate-binding domain-containing protein, partial [Longimicrobiales bacterium]|nr:PEP/pyruvate-binding domain-containing protein [Longimicrobiales bacterium]
MDLADREAHPAVGPSSRLLVSLDDPACSDPGLAGSKAATLSFLASHGFPVPEGMVLTTHAFRDALAPLERPGVEAGGSLPLPPPVETALLRVIDLMGPGPLAVRSSSPAEDLAGSSFAGQYETVLGVEGPEQLVEAVRRCWASVFSIRAVAYRERQEIDPAAMAVLIQRQVPAEVAGVAFTADPVTGARDVTVIDAVAGLGERLVSGEADPERWRVTPDGPERTTEGDAGLRPAQAQAVGELAREVEALFA